MYALKTLVAVLAFSLVSVSGVPLHRHHRRTCRTHSSSDIAATSTVSASSSSAVATSSAIPTTTTDAPASTTTDVASTSIAESSSEAIPTTHESSSAHATKTSSSSAAPTSSSSSSGGPITGLLKKLFPVAESNSWTTSSASNAALPLSDNTFGVTKLIKEIAPVYVSAPDGVKSMKATYPQGSYIPSQEPRGGLSFYATGPSNFDLDNAKEATLSYTVYFEDDFDFVKGGKLPGLYGGNSDSEATSCSGGRRDDGCWSARFMWRTGGAGEMYTYLPPSYAANKAVCSVAPKSECNSVYGASVGRGSFSFAAGKRTMIGQRVRLNDVGQENGELELFVDGKSVFTVGGLVLRNSEAGRFRGIQMQTFFGGSDSSWASPKDQSTYFSDFSVAVTEKL